MSERILSSQFNSYITRCTNKALKNFGRSYSKATVENKTGCILDVYTGEGVLVVSDDWRDRIKFQSIYKDDRSKENYEIMGIKNKNFIDKMESEYEIWKQKHVIAEF